MPASVETISCLLYRCRKERDAFSATQVLEYMNRGGLNTHHCLGNYLVSMLVVVGRLCSALKVFEKLINPNISSWNSIITGHVNCGMFQHALVLYKKMQTCGSIDAYGQIFLALIEACSELKDMQAGQEIHKLIASNGLLKGDLFLGSSLITMYANCGCISKGEEVFDSYSPVRDTVIWNALITAYVNCGFDANALTCFEKMQVEGISPNVVTYICSLRACGNLAAIEKGREIHGEVYRKKLHENDVKLSNALVDMYAKCGVFSKAHEVFERLAFKNVISWTSLIAGYVKHGQGAEALKCFKQMQLEGISPNVITYVCGLRACGSLRNIEMGQEIHYEVTRKGLERDALIGGALLDMCAKCGLLKKAQEVFDCLPNRGIILWTTLISGYVNHGHNEDALTCLKLMQLEHISPNVATYLSCLKACGNIGAIERGQEIHAEIARKGLLERDHLLVGNALIHMYVKCGIFVKAQELFDNLQIRDIISWTTLITGYAEQDQPEEALHYFEQMQSEGFSATAATFVCTLKACGNIGAAVKGRKLHGDIMRKGLEMNLIVGSTLVDMYAKCGLLPIAQQVFDKLSIQDVILWNSLIAGYVQLGQSNTVFTLFDRMRQEGKRPDVITFTSVLSVCSQVGLVNQGLTYFEIMSKEYGILPTFQHHGCMVDLLGRVGELHNAIVIMERMPTLPNVVLLRTVLTSCQKWGNIELGRKAFHNVLTSNDSDCLCIDPP